MCDNFLMIFQHSAGSAPYPTAIFKYSPEQGYQAANVEFSDYYAESIKMHEELLDRYIRNLVYAEVDGHSICDVSKLVLDYLYSGQTEKAWELLYQIYPAEMADQYKGKILTGLEDNVFYEEP